MWKNNKYICFIIFIFLYMLSLKVVYIGSLKLINVNEYKGHTCEAVIVLGGRDDYDRILKGLELAQYNKHSLIVFSGVHKKYKKIIDSFKLNKAIFDTLPTNTYENAIYSKQYLEKDDIKNICLVSSEAHMFRAKKVFEFQDLNVYPVISNIVSKQIKPKYFFPDLKYFVLNISVLYEYLAIVDYKLKGKM